LQLTSNPPESKNMKSHHSKNILAGVALAGLMSGSAVRLHAAASGNSASLSSGVGVGLLAADASTGKHDCKGQNACKGQGGCKSGSNGCKGKNDCKGKGGCSTNTPASS
jgi:hypothetical protein